MNDLPAGASLEGYVFPDTYGVPRDKVTARDIIATALRNFDKQVTPQMRADLQAQGRTLYDAIRLASIVEREAAVEAERPTIAGVYFNRLNDGMALDADPTIQYALGNTRDPNTWWPQITQEDYQGVDSPYNLYRNLGLPPSPIDNPALASIQAAIYPEKHDFYFFRTSCTQDGTHVLPGRWTSRSRTSASSDRDGEWREREMEPRCLPNYRVDRDCRRSRRFARCSPDRSA